MASGVYLDTLGDVIANTVSLDLTNCKLALYDSSLVVDFTVNGAAYGSGNLGSHELAAAGGYSTGGKAVSSLAFAITSGVLVLSGTVAAWTSATFTARYALLYDVTSNRAIYLVDFGTDRTVASATFTVIFQADQILTLTP